MAAQLLTDHLRMHSQFLMDLRAGKVELTQSALDDQIKIMELSIQYSDAMEKQNAEYADIASRASAEARAKVGGRLQ